ncbi:MAG: glycosyltransferase [Actinomycetota bacterium]|nr:glycosyltransferase [Actinomycetota bacterium]
MSEVQVAAVVVTWNRRELLAQSLQAIQRQTLAPAVVIVVDNASDDGTGRMLAERFPQLEVVQALVNTGGAGGFAIGLEEALSRGCRLVWLMDDDTVPEATALAQLVSARQRYVGAAPALVASRVIWTDGRDHPMNTPRAKPGMRVEERAASAEVGCIPIRSASFVSVLVDADLVRERGLPIADYFLWNDDFEFTTRIIRGGRALYCPASVVVHKTRTFGATDADPGERFFYEVRNKIWLFSRSDGLSLVEKALYAGSTVRRWTRTIGGSRDRRTLWRGLRAGVVAGVKTRPRPTEDVIAAATGRQPRRD